MLAIPSRHRPLILLAIVVLAQVLLLAVQIKRERDVRLIRIWAVALVTPVQRAGAYTIDKVGSTWNNYVALHNTRRENEELRAEVARLQLRTAQLESGAAEAVRLAALLGFREGHAEAPMVAGRVIGASAVGASRTVYINRGERDGLRRNQGVITPSGVVGKILEVYPDTAQVLLITDKESGVGALLESSRTQGVVRGTGEPFVMLNYVINDEEVRAGEGVLTSGLDRIFPKDLPVGTVVETKPGSPFKFIRVRPAARLDRLEEVLVLLTRQELVETKEGGAAETRQGAKAHAPPGDAAPKKQ